MIDWNDSVIIIHHYFRDRCYCESISLLIRDCCVVDVLFTRVYFYCWFVGWMVLLFSWLFICNCDQKSYTFYIQKYIDSKRRKRKRIKLNQLLRLAMSDETWIGEGEVGCGLTLCHMHCALHILFVFYCVSIVSSNNDLSIYQYAFRRKQNDDSIADAHIELWSLKWKELSIRLFLKWRNKEETN